MADSCSTSAEVDASHILSAPTSVLSPNYPASLERDLTNRLDATLAATITRP